MTEPPHNVVRDKFPPPIERLVSEFKDNCCDCGELKEIGERIVALYGQDVLSEVLDRALGAMGYGIAVAEAQYETIVKAFPNHQLKV